MPTGRHASSARSDITFSQCEVQNGAAHWGGVLAVALGAFALIASEFMPVSLLTPIAADLGISEGQAGQAISVSGGFALLTSLFVSTLAGQLDRKILLLGLTVLMIASGTVVAFAPNYAVFMLGRALIGVAIGGFWSMSTAVAMRLVPEHQVPRAMAIVNGGNALATVIAAPLGSYLAAFVGWRWAFFCVVPITAIALGWKLVSLPRMAALPATGSGNALRLLKDRQVMLGMLAVSLFFMGQFALFTYLRPFLETATHVSASMLSLLLLVVGVAGVAGTTIIGSVLKFGLSRTLAIIPLLMASIAVALALAGSSLIATAILLGFWGFIGTAAPVAWWTWLARSLPRDAEAGGGLMVAVIQLAIALGAIVGGVLFDANGYHATFGASALLLAAAAAVSVFAARTDTSAFANPQLEAVGSR
ncbi:MAG: MFS transporter [Burkholderiales bacterium]